jgi:uncharacterized membrane protein
MQNPPPGKQSYGTQTGSPAPTAGSGLDPKIAAALSYIWIVGVVFWFIEKENKFVRFHAMQSIIFGISNSVIMTVLAILAGILTFVGFGASAAIGGGVGALAGMLVWLIWLLFWLVALVLFIGLIFAAIKAYQGQKFKLPIIGNMAEKYAEK